MAETQGPIARRELTELQLKNLKALGNLRDTIIAGIEKTLEKHGVKLFVGQIAFTTDEYAAKEMRAEEGCCCCPDGSYRCPCNNCERDLVGEPGTDTFI